MERLVCIFVTPERVEQWLSAAPGRPVSPGEIWQYLGKYRRVWCTKQNGATKAPTAHKTPLPHRPQRSLRSETSKKLRRRNLVQLRPEWQSLEGSRRGLREGLVSTLLSATLRPRPRVLPVPVRATRQGEQWSRGPAWGPAWGP